MMDDKMEYEGMIAEMNAGKVLRPRTYADEAWNQAIERSVGIVKRYEKGTGLFQQKTEAPDGDV